MHPWSVRSILNAVFLALALGLCGVLLAEIGQAWQSVELGRRLTLLADANRAVFQAMQTLREKSNATLVALQGSDDAAAVVSGNRAQTKAIIEATLDAVGR